MVIHMIFLKLYGVALFVFFGIDLLWLGVIAKNLYQNEIGFLLSESVKWQAAILFYLLYIAGLVFFALLPLFSKGTWLSVLLCGGFFGLICYATYDLTNLATLKGWPVKIVIYDLLWGAFVSGFTCLITFWIGKHFAFK
jgi:uncharacterized membrane protein